jgi:hypothetical protein
MGSSKSVSKTVVIETVEIEPVTLGTEIYRMVLFNGTIHGLKGYW